MNTYERKATIVNRKFYKYLLPTVLSTIAISLNEFVDSIIVSQLLGSKAMMLVNIGFPIMLAFAVAYTLLGVGGSVIYSKCAGARKNKKAGKTFTMTFVIAIVVSVVFFAVGLLFLDEIAIILCNKSELVPEFLPYLRVLVISSVWILPLQVLITFFPAFGSPGVGTAVNVVANAVNLLMDVIYIRFFNTGLMGAALATLTGYVMGALLVIVFVILKKVKLPFTSFKLNDLKEYPKVLSSGLAPAINQFGYCIKISFCNDLALDIAGVSGAAVFALCIQVVSIVSVVICGIVSAMTPIAAFLKGQGDNRGISLLMRTVMLIQFVSNLVIVILIEVFPQSLLFIYAIGADLETMAIIGLRIFSIMFIFRGFVFTYMYYYQVISRNVYATILSVVDGFAGLIPITLILTHFLGINGLWLAFPVLSLIMIIGIVIANMIIARKSAGKYKGLLLSESEDVRVCDLTIPLTNHDAVENAKNIRKFCKENGLNDKLSMIVEMALEEMVVYTIEHADKSSLEVMDVLVKIHPDYVSLDMKSMGKPFDVTSSDNDKFSNIDVLKKIATTVSFDYNIGMNNTRVTVERKQKT